MSDITQYERQVAELSKELQSKLRLRKASFATLVSRSRNRLPRSVFKNAMTLVEAEEFAHHPKLNRTLDFAALTKAARVVSDHLDSIDLADQRKGRILSTLGSVSINLIAVVILFIAVLMWRGYL